MENATDNATCADNATCVSTKDSDFEWAKSLHKRVEGIEFDALKNALHAARGAQRAVDARRDAEHLSAAALSALAAQLGDLVVGLGASLGLAGGAAEDLLEDSIVNRASLAALHAVTWDDVQRLNATALADADARERSRSAVERFVGEAARKEETARSERLATLLRSHTERHLAFDDDHRLNASAVLRAVERNFKVWWVRRGLDAGCVAFERDPLALIAARLEDAALRLKAWCAALPFSDLASERVAAAYASANAYASGACGVDVGEQVWQVTQEVSIVFSRLAAAAGLYEALSAAARALLVQWPRRAYRICGEAYRVGGEAYRSCGGLARRAALTPDAAE
ncbi:hypothetical protein M885DRAFT_519942 [Pelagophyceae sp. CCMP2097]|nr:hypothetical protein M885DRAFT_519942 [Pelagophyceae sp. CCMP2097]